MSQQSSAPVQRQPARGAPPPSSGAGASAPSRGATTVDSLFGPLPPTESFGQAWLYLDGKLQRVRLRLGVSDGQQTEVIQALDGDIKEGTDVVTSILTGPARQVAPPAGGNAFPGLGGGRGFGGGGGRGGRGG